MPEAARQPEHYIAVKPGYLGGKPHIVGHRIKVQDVAVRHKRMGLSVDEVAFQYGLELPEIYAALSYYLAHREEIEHSLREKEKGTEATSRTVPSKLQERLKELCGD